VSVTDSFTLPGQPTVGFAAWVPLGGDGITAPLGYYDVNARLVGDAGGGVAQIAMSFDPRYTNLLSFLNLQVFADTAATEFAVDLIRNSSFAGINLAGTLPFVTEGLVTTNSAWIWYPPQQFYAGEGRVRYTTDNVDATETYAFTAQVYAYNRDVRRYMNMTWLSSIIPSTNSPAAT